jgi:3-oxoadipate enol-lactonase
MPFAPAGDVSVYYEVHGPAVGAAPALVFAHGMGGSHLSWWQQVPHFSDRYTCVVFDHRGFGQSLVPPGSEQSGAAFRADLRALLDHLGIVRASLVAQSMGGWTCLGFALAHPGRVERLVMCDTHGGLNSPEIAAAWGSALRAAAQGWPAGVHPAAGARMYREQPTLHFLYAELSALNAVRTPPEMGAILRSAGAPTPAEVASLLVPVLFIAGEDDDLIPPRVLELAAACFPDARLERVPAAGHSVYFERPQVFNQIVDRFLAAPGADPLRRGEGSAT